MALPWFDCEPVDADFFDAAPVRLVGRFQVPQPAAAVWEELTADHTLAWCRILDDVVWTSPRPYGVGTTRTAKALKGANVLEERFFRWEEGRRKSFTVLRSTSPLFKRFAEDYLVEPRGEDACTFTWTVAYAPRALARPALPVNKRLLATLFADTARHYGLAGA